MECVTRSHCSTDATTLLYLAFKDTPPCTVEKTTTLQSTPNASNPKETSWGLLGQVFYKSYHCVFVRNCFPLKLYVYLKNIVLHNILCEIYWIVFRTQFYRMCCEKVTQKSETGPVGPQPSLFLIRIT